MARTTKAAAAQVTDVDTKTMDLLAEVAPAAPNTVMVIVKTPAERAISALNSTARELELAELVKKSADIVEVKNADARAQVHRMAMDLKNTRCAITNQSEEARSDATAFSRAVLAEERRLLAITDAEEKRLFKLRDDFDKAEADAKAELERLAAERAAEIKAALDAITGLPAKHAAATSAELTVVLQDLATKELTEAEFGDKLGEAAVAVDTTAGALIALRDGALAREQAEAERIRLQEEEKQRIAAQAEANRVEAARLAQEAEAARVAQAERERVAAIEQAERDRVAADAKRQLEEMLAKVAADRRAQELAAAELKAAQVLQQVAMHEVKNLHHLGAVDGDVRTLDTAISKVKETPEFAAPMGEMVEMARDLALSMLEARLAYRLEKDLPDLHAEALDDNALFDAERAPLVEVESEAMLMGGVDMDGNPAEIDWDALPETLPLPECAERDAEINATPGPTKATGMEVVDLVGSEYGMTREQTIEFLDGIDFKALKGTYGPA